MHGIDLQNMQLCYSLHAIEIREKITIITYL